MLLLPNITLSVKNFLRYETEKEQANHLVILTFLLPGDASHVEYNTVAEDSPPILHEEGAGEAFGDIKRPHYLEMSPPPA